MNTREAVAGMAAAHVMGLRVAELGLWLDARGAGLRLAAPPGHSRFLQPQTSALSGDLILPVRNGPLPETKVRRTLLCKTEIWELWLDEAGRYVFVAPRRWPPRWAVVDTGFTAGEVIGDFSSRNGEGCYPLQGIDIMFIANWLAGYGDVILHAAGVVLDEKGYCFVGPAGVGKSTLAAYLSMNHSALVLGEDQVILRYRECRFWIYGTPWHESPAMCSPRGVPLERLFFLDRTAGAGVAACTPLDGVARLLQTAFVPYYRPEAVSGILERLALLAQQVPFYTLSYQLGADVLKLIREV